MVKKKNKHDDERNESIAMAIIVDSYGPEEHAMSWYYYLEEQLQFPFSALCSTRRATSSLQLHEEVKDLKMAPEEACQTEMFVNTAAP